MTTQRQQRLRDVLSRRQPDLTVLMERVQKWHNFSAILRTCDAVGVVGAHAVIPKHGMPQDPQGNTNPASDLEDRGHNTNSTSGSAAKWVKVHTYPDAPSALTELKRQGLSLYAAHFSERAVDYRSVDYTKPTCILLGTERWGISEEAAQAAQEHILIPMLGMVQSLNVSVAAAVILFEAQRQRLAAGMYEQSRLEAEQYRQVWAEWTQIQVKKPDQ
jgi:tRNA (guanosine-2'-O-)-methyltransferase